MRRFAGVIVGALALVALSAAPASAGLLDRYILDIHENPAQVKVDGPGFKVKLTKHELTTQIDDARFGFPHPDHPIERPSQPGPGPGARPYVCENGTYRATATGRGTFAGVERVSSDEPRPVPPYTDAFNTGFGNPFTFVGTLTATVTNESGETFTLMMSDLANEVRVLGRYFISTNPIHAFFVDSQGKIRDRASLVGRVVVDEKTDHAVHWVVDRGTCHQRAALPFGGDNAVVFGPFFVLPFNTTVIGG